MLIRMRSVVAKVLVFGLFTLLILSFAVWGIGDIFYRSDRITAVAEVGDLEIDQREFSRDLSREMSRLQQRLGTRLSLEQASALGIVEQTLQKLVTGALLDAQAADMGLTVTEQQVLDQITADSSFHNAQGSFDRNRFAQVLRSNNLSEGEYLQSLRSDVQRRQLTRPLLGAGTAPKALAETIRAYLGEKRSAEVVEVSVASVPEPAGPDDAVLATFHQENSQLFMAPQTRAVTYVELSPEDLMDEVAISEDEAREALETRIEEFVDPERRQVRQLVFADQDAAKTAHQALVEGRSFETVAEETLGAAPVDLGLMSRAEIEAQLPDLAEAAFALAEGHVSEPVSSPFGWHILQVGEIRAGGDPSFEAARDRVVETLQRERAIESIVSIANQLDDQLAGGATLEEVAASLDLPLRKIPAIDAAGNDADGSRIDDLPGRTRFLATMAETVDGQDSLLTEADDGGYFILRVDSVTPSALRPLAEVRAQAIEEWKRRERERLAGERADALLERAKAGETLQQLAEAEGLAVETLGPYERFASDPDGGATRALVETLFELEPEALSTAEAPDGVYLVKLTAVEPAPSEGAAERAKQVREQLAQQLQNELFAAFTESLRREHPVKVNRGLIQEIVERY